MEKRSVSVSQIKTMQRTLKTAIRAMEKDEERIRK